MGVLLHGTAMGVFLGLGALLPRDRSQKLIHTDLLINVATGGAIFLLLKPVMNWVSESLQWHIYAPPIEHPVLQFFLAFLLIDFSRYWLHYVHHRVPFFWQFHRVHHSSERLDSTSGLRMHVFDFLQLGLIPIFWFGVVLDVQQWSEWVVPWALGVGVLFDAFQHANLRFDLSKPWNKAWHMLFNNPHFHVWHHTRDGKKQDGNYGNSLVVWDRIFGTEVTKEHVPPLLGISAEQNLKNDPISLQLLRRR